MSQITSFDEKLLRLINGLRNHEEVKSTIQKENLYNVIDCSKNTLLHMAATINEVITKYLIDSGSEVDAQNEHGETPLMSAIRADCDETTEILLEAGANIELRDSLGNTALQLIGESDTIGTNVMRITLQKLQSICFNNKEEIAKKLMDAYWPLQFVVEMKDSDLTKIILQRGYAAKIDALDGHLMTALHSAIQSINVENVRVLLEFNADVNFVDGYNRTSLCYVYDNGTARPNERFIILKMLLNRGAMIDCEHGDEAYEVFEYANRQAMKLLFQFNIDKPINFNQLDALLMLAKNEKPGAIEEVRGRGFDVNVRNGSNQTPLIIAAMWGNTRAVEVFLNEGADVNAVDIRNWPALFYAVHKSVEYEQCVQLLLERGADVQYEIVSPQQNETTTIFNLILSDNLFSLCELVVAHLALQEALGKSITKTIRTQINSCDIFKIHFEMSKLILSMKVYWFITLSDVLTADKKLEGYARNEEFVLTAQVAVNAMSHHHYFFTLLLKRLSKAKMIAALKMEAARIISNIMGMSYDRIPLIADNIINFSTQEDMKNLIHASL